MKCPDCAGNGEIVLFTSREPCKRCGGEGQLAEGGTGKKGAPFANKEKQKLISEYFKTSEGRRKLSASLAEPLRKRRTYDAFNRAFRRHGKADV